MIEAIILGIVQGLTEFLPVSSTAHLILIPEFFGWHGDLNTLTYDIALHGGTLLALLVYFRKQWLDLLTVERPLLLKIAIATIPAGVAGVLFKDAVSTTLRNSYVIAASLVVVGLVMLLSEKTKARRGFSSIRTVDALAIGLAQAVALIPGVSRSGITISAGLFGGIEREASARFSFLLSMPVIAGATLLEGVHVLKNQANYDMGLFAAGFAASAVTGFVTIKFLLWFFRRFSLRTFVYYRFALAGIIVVSYLS
ncbi:MAG: undecaprenyl-diphosphate phosphatase [Nitrospirae bacterium]|nr:undecaprenyl-diphosphate phosphatase [Nitrospirota bacterium]